MDKLNADECRAISRGTCPDCGHRGFRVGPRGGSATLNIECMGCGMRFNAVMVSGAVGMGDRLGVGDPWPTQMHAIHIVQAIVGLLPDGKAEGLALLEQAKRMVQRFKR